MSATDDLIQQGYVVGIVLEHDPEHWAQIAAAAESWAIDANHVADPGVADAVEGLVDLMARLADGLADAAAAQKNNARPPDEPIVLPRSQRYYKLPIETPLGMPTAVAVKGAAATAHALTEDMTARFEASPEEAADEGLVYLLNLIEHLGSQLDSYADILADRAGAPPD